MTGFSRCAPLFATLFCLVGVASAQSNRTVSSPNKRIEVTVHAGDRITYDVAVDAKPVLQNCALSIDVDGKTLGAGASVATAKERSVDDTVTPVVRQKFATIPERFNELRLDLSDGLAVVFRVYDLGVAYRLETSLRQPEVTVRSEEATFAFAGTYKVFYPEEESLFSHQERVFTARTMKDIPATSIASLPAVVEANGVTVAIAEAGVDDYPGLWLRGTGDNGLVATFAPYPLEEAFGTIGSITSDRDFKVTKAADYIAKTAGTRTYPWRVLGIASRDADLIANPLVYLLEEPSKLQDTSWIKPGKVAWDWWNANNVYGVDFKSGVNTATYKYYIDFAAKNGIDYIVLDEGWYKLGNVLEVVPDINVQELVDYGKAKNVGVILWVVWKTLDQQLIPALDQFQKWGVKGIKVDFMQRDDQPMMRWYGKICREAAARKMLVDFHGTLRTASLTRTWPEPHQHGGCARARVEQVEHGVESRAQPHAPLHADVPRTDGLHAGRDAQREPAGLHGSIRAADGPRNALPSARDVRRFRKPSTDARRQPVELHTRAGVHVLPRPGPDGLGRHETARWQDRRLRRGRSSSRFRLVRWCDDRLDGSRSYDRSILPAGRKLCAHGLRRRREHQPFR